MGATLHEPPRGCIGMNPKVRGAHGPGQVDPRPGRAALPESLRIGLGAIGTMWCSCFGGLAQGPEAHGPLAGGGKYTLERLAGSKHYPTIP